MARRQNPGGTSPYLDGKLLGFAGVIDITPALDPITKKAKLAVKVGTGAVQVKEADFSATPYSTLAPGGAAAVLEAAGFTGVEFETDAETGRLALKATDPSIKYVQIYSDLAAALNFGDCRYTEGYGCYFYNGFTEDLKSATPTISNNENIVIENDNGWGDKVSYTRPGSRGSAQIDIVDRRVSNTMKQMVEGGTLKRGSATEPDIYEPPGVADVGERRLDVHIFTDLFNQKNNAAGSQFRIQEDVYIGCVGHIAESSAGGAWAESTYSLMTGGYTDPNEPDPKKREKNSPKSLYYNRSQWEALNMKAIVEIDWERHVNP
jgi:hypothetical protein